MTQVHLVLRSDNAKTGPIPVSTTAASTCPTACPFRKNGCYADGGPLKLHWDKVSRKERGTDWKQFIEEVRALPAGTLWRHNQAGDLPGAGNRIDSGKFLALVAANAGKRGFTYTHKPMHIVTNRHNVKAANQLGFTVNLSANSLEEADDLLELGVGPVVTTLPRSFLQRSLAGDKLFTHGGNRVIVCPAQTHDNVNCDTCRMCALPDRPFIIGFLAHGSGAARVERIYERK